MPSTEPNICPTSSPSDETVASVAMLYPKGKPDVQIRFLFETSWGRVASMRDDKVIIAREGRLEVFDSFREFWIRHPNERSAGWREINAVDDKRAFWLTEARIASKHLEQVPIEPRETSELVEVHANLWNLADEEMAAQILTLWQVKWGNIAELMNGTIVVKRDERVAVLPSMDVFWELHRDEDSATWHVLQSIEDKRAFCAKVKARSKEIQTSASRMRPVEIDVYSEGNSAGAIEFEPLEELYERNRARVAPSLDALRRETYFDTSHAIPVYQKTIAGRRANLWQWFLFATVAIGIWNIIRTLPKLNRLPPEFIAQMVGLMIIPLVVYCFIFRHARRSLAFRAVRSVRETIIKDPRRPIVFLRSFKDDSRRLGQMPWSNSIEETLVSELMRFGPCIAIGRPGEALPPVGAARDYVPDDDWQELVVSWISEARLVVVLLSDTPGLQWELDMIARLGLLDKLVVLSMTSKKKNEPIDQISQVGKVFGFSDARAARVDVPQLSPICSYKKPDGSLSIMLAYQSHNDLTRALRIMLLMGAVGHRKTSGEG